MIKLLSLALASIVFASPFASKQEDSPRPGRTESVVATEPIRMPLAFAFVDGVLFGCHVEGVGIVQLTSCMPGDDSFSLPAERVIEVTWVDAKGRTITVKTFCMDYAGNMELCARASKEAVDEMEKSYPPKPVSETK